MRLHSHMLPASMQDRVHPPGSAAHFPLDHIAHDIRDSQSRLRGLVLRGPHSWCAYVGAPFLSELQDLRFKCHFGWNYASPGDGKPLPAGHYWWGRLGGCILQAGKPCSLALRSIAPA